jgi:hypothetical protein
MRTSGTVRSFFSGINNGWPWENHNPLTQLSKAAALFERAARLAATWRPGAAILLCHLPVRWRTNCWEEIQNIGSFYSDFVAVDQRIDEFKPQLTPIDRVSSQNVPLLHLAYCLSNGATIQLHATFSSQNTGSRAKCLSAAMAIVRANQAAHVQEYVFTSPILGVSVCHSFISNFNSCTDCVSDMWTVALGCLWSCHRQRDCRAAMHHGRTDHLTRTA